MIGVNKGVKLIKASIFLIEISRFSIIAITTNHMRYLLLIPVLLLFSACRQATKYPYAISDFPVNIRPFLTAIVTEGYIGDKTYEPAGTIREIISDADLFKLTKCEHPILRSLGLDIVSKRKHPDHYSIMMDHLDDTARVSWYFQCASYPQVYVSDYMIRNYEWNSIKEKNRTISKIIRDHHYLMSAYEALGKTDSLEQYHSIIRQMAEKDIFDMRYLSLAWHKLDEPGKPEDLAFLREQMMQKYSDLDCNGFAILARHPDSISFAIMKKSYKYYYRRWCERGENSSEEEENMKCFLKALAAFRNKEAATMLEKIFYRQPFMPCYPPDSTWIRETLYEAISNNPSPEYGNMLRIANDYLDKKRKEDAKNSIYLLDPVTDSASTDPPVKIRWQN